MSDDDDLAGLRREVPQTGGVHRVKPEYVALGHPRQVVGNDRAEAAPQHQDEHDVGPLDIEEARAVWAPSEHPPEGGVTHY